MSDFEYALEPIITSLTALVENVILYGAAIFALVLVLLIIGKVHAGWLALDAWLWKRRLERQRR